MQTEIIPLSNEHIATITSMHMQYLRSPFQGKSGEHFLQTYYNTLIKQKGGCGYVAITNNKIAGFVCGIWDPTIVKSNLVKEHWESLLITSFQVLFHSPKLIVDLVSRLIKTQKEEYSNLLGGYELRPIVVDETFRGTEVASLLVSELAMDAKKRGYSSIYLLTEQDNIPANKFYQKHEFKYQGTIIKSKQDYAYYTRRL